jgi:hypothetical protein
MTALEYLAPVIAVCMAIAGGCFVVTAYHTWKRLPEPQAYRTKYGRLVRRK